VIPLTLFLLGCAAVYVGTVQAAFSALLRLSLRYLTERDSHDSHLVRYLEDPVELFVPIRLLLGVIVAVAVPLMARLTGIDGTHRVAGLVLAIAAFGGVCEFVLPALIVRRNPERALGLVLPGFVLVSRFLSPITSLITSLLLEPRRDRTAAAGGAPTGEDGGAAAAQPEPESDQGQREQREQDERRLLRSIVDFGETVVRAVMTPRPDIVAIRADATLDELRMLVREQGYSRIPVFREGLDNILGVAYVKDLAQLSEADRTGRAVSSLMRPAYFVPETKKVSELLKEFQRQQVQSAIVVDEYGGTAGLVTIEDLLEELVGEIRDEYDVEAEPVVEETDGAFVLSGKVNIDAAAERLGVRIEREGFETVGGYLLARLGRVPVVGETLEIDGLSVHVLEAERRRVHRVRVRRLPPAPEPAGGERE
jgi:putative hemolysin